MTKTVPTLAVGALLAFSGLASAAPVNIPVFGGDYVTGNQTLQSAIAPTSTGFSTPFSTSTVRQPSSAYTGPAFRGGYEVVSSGITLGGNTNQTQRVSNVGTTDRVHVQAVTTNSSQSPAAGSFVTLKGAFAFDLGAGTAYSLIESASVGTHLNFFDGGNYVRSAEYRLLIGNGTSWFASDSAASRTSTGVSTLNIADVQASTWRSYDTSTFTVGGTVAAPSTVTWIGYAFSGSGTVGPGSPTIGATNATVGAGLESLSYTVVPEPASLTALALLGAGLIRRQRA